MEGLSLIYALLMTQLFQPPCLSPSAMDTQTVNELEMEFVELMTWMNNTSAWLSTLQEPSTYRNINYEVRYYILLL